MVNLSSKYIKVINKFNENIEIDNLCMFSINCERICHSGESFILQNLEFHFWKTDMYGETIKVSDEISKIVFDELIKRLFENKYFKREYIKITQPRNAAIPITSYNDEEGITGELTKYRNIFFIKGDTLKSGVVLEYLEEKSVPTFEIDTPYYLKHVSFRSLQRIRKYLEVKGITQVEKYVSEFLKEHEDLELLLLKNAIKSTSRLLEKYSISDEDWEKTTESKRELFKNLKDMEIKLKKAVNELTPERRLIFEML